MPLMRWEDLPTGVREIVEAETGPVVRAESASEGIHSDVATVLELTGNQRVFVKAATVGSPSMWMHRNEVRVGRQLPEGIAPGVEWALETESWAVTGFACVDGRHVDLSPGSPDLPGLAELATTLAERLTPSPVPALGLGERWAQLPTWGRHDPNLLAGNTLVHTDLSANNVLVDASGRMTVVDWAWPAQGAEWIDTAYLIVRLIRAGHTPEQAEAWAADVMPWKAAAPEAVEAFTAAVTDLWTARPAPHTAELLAATARWTAYRASKSAV